MGYLIAVFFHRPSSTNAGYSAYQNFVLNDKRGLSLVRDTCMIYVMLWPNDPYMNHMGM